MGIARVGNYSKKTLRGVFNILFPLYSQYSNGDYSRYIDTKLIHTQPTTKNLTYNTHITQCWYLFDYSDHWVEQTLYKIKNDKEYERIREFQLCFSEAIKKIQMEKNLHFDIITPIAREATRYILRGFFVPDDLLNKITNKTSLFKNYISKTPHTILNKKQRKLHLKGKISIRHECLEALSTCKTILLVDDIVTTGATFCEHARILQKINPKIQVYCLALVAQV